MTYEHPNYVPWTINTGFSRGLSDDPNAWRSFIVSSNIKAAARRSVERRRQEGIDPGHTVNPQRMQIHRDNLVVRKPQSGSKAARMRALLATGAKTSVELGAAIGVASNAVRQYLAHDIDHGRVVRVIGTKPLRYELARPA